MADPPWFQLGFVVNAPHGNEGLDVEVVTALLTDILSFDQPLPTIVVSLHPVPLGIGPFGQAIDLLGAELVKLGMAALSSLAEVADHQTTGWSVVVRAATKHRPSEGEVVAHGSLFASNVRPYPMWQEAVADQGDRVAVYYASGVHLPVDGQVNILDVDRLEHHARQGQLLGTMAPVTWRR